MKPVVALFPNKSNESNFDAARKSSLAVCVLVILMSYHFGLHPLEFHCVVQNKTKQKHEIHSRRKGTVCALIPNMLLSTKIKQKE